MPHLSPVREQAESYFAALQSRLAETSSAGTAGSGTAVAAQVDRGLALETLKGFYQESWAGLKLRHEHGASGRDVVCGHTGLMDAVLRQVFALAVENLRARDLPVSLIATGGYGRGELNPCSDVDILFVYDGILSQPIRDLSEWSLYFLWDMGLALGHSVRSIGESIQAARVDTVTKTSFLESRPVAGDAGVADRFRAAVAAELVARKAEAFIREKLNDAHKRRTRFGESVFLREPHLKEGEGGLRDYQTALWIAKVKYRVATFEGLIPLGVLSQEEADGLGQSLDFIWRLRNELHYRYGRRNDVLSFEVQEAIARSWGYADHEGFTALERFMREYYRQAKRLATLSRNVITRAIRKGARPFGPLSVLRRRHAGDGIYVTSRNIFASEQAREAFVERPALALRLFEESQRHGLPVSDVTIEGLTALLPRIPSEAWSGGEAAERFRAILSAPRGVADTLNLMHECGVLDRILPEFAALRCLVQHNPYHTYTVDTHTLIAVRNLEQLRGTVQASRQPLAQALSQIQSPGLLFLATLLHDSGKSFGAERMHLALDLLPGVAGRLGLTADETQRLHFLVAEHQTMSQIAQRRELSDPRVVADFAGRVGDIENLRMLYLLTYADISAVGPDVWSDWKGALLRELADRTREVLERRRVAVPERAEQISEARDAIRTLARGVHPEDVVESFLSMAPDTYLLMTPPERALEHLELRRRLPEEKLIIAHRHMPEMGVTDLTVCMYDAFGIFSKTCGTLAAHNMNIVGARIVTMADGVVLDSLQVTDPAGRIVRDETIWEGVERSLGEILTGVRRVEALWSKSSIRLRKKDLTIGGVMTKIVVDNDLSDRHTVVEVYAHDRIGILYRITKALYELGLSVANAKISTELTQVIDVFYVTDLLRHKITSVDRIKKIEETLLAAVAEPGPKG
ncbi:MAG: [protein-PII] uridylyltransferase [Nitrospirae bacterium]|nr:[protein-PII] uridylyltransferase [Nitrospirota bacterium]